MPNSYLRPGVYVNESLTGSTASGGAVGSSVAAFVGAGNIGPSIPTLVPDWNTYTTLFGGLGDSPYLAQSVFSYFANGASACYVARVASSTAVAASRTLNDTATTPLATLKLTAASVGSYGNNIYVDINAGYTAGRFDLVIKYGGATAPYTVETITDLTMQSTDPRYAPAIINTISRWVTATDMNSTTAAPANAPAVQTGTALATGSDGAGLSSLAAADYQTVVNRFSGLPQPLVMNLPGVNDTTTLNNTITFAQNETSVFVVIDPPQGQTVAQVQSFASGLTSSSFAAVYYPWVKIIDPTKAIGQVQKTVPPGGSVVGQFMRADYTYGPFRTPAGTSYRLSGAVDLETRLLPSDYDALNSGTPAVNAIKPVTGYGLCVYGGRTLKSSFADRFIAVRRSLIYIEKNLVNLTQFAVFQPNNDYLWSVITSVVGKFLSDYHAQGGLRGIDASEAFYVRCDDSNNSVTDIQNGVVNIEVGVALQYPTEFVVLRVAQFEGGSTATTIL